MRWVALLALLTLVGSGCSSSSAEIVPPGGARTCFEALDTSTPSAAAETFLDAFARDDFMTVWLVFHPETQNRIEQTLNLLNYDEVVNSEAIPHDEIAQIVRSFPPESIGTWYLFDQLMLVAGEHDAFTIDLSGPARITGETVDGDQAEVSAEAEGIEGPVIVSMKKSPKGRWRVLSVATGGEGAPAVVWPGS